MAGNINYIRDGVRVLQDLLAWAEANPNLGYDLARDHLIGRGWNATLVDDVMMLTEDFLIRLYDISKDR